MGGMYTEQLRGFDRICINPALEIAETMKAHGMTGTQQFQNPRLDGIQEFYVDKASTLVTYILVGLASLFTLMGIVFGIVSVNAKDKKV